LHQVGFIEKILDTHLIQTGSCILAGIAIGSMAFMPTFSLLGFATILLGAGNAICDLGEENSPITIHIVRELILFQPSFSWSCGSAGHMV